MGMTDHFAGVLTQEELRRSTGYTMDAAMKHNGALVVIECNEDIPCNPCETVCPFGAITVGEPITNTPVVAVEKCNGCGQCVAICPGLAVFLVNHDVGGGMSELTFPYEYLPTPVKGSKVTATDRAGRDVCDAEVTKVISTKQYSLTNVITIRFPAEHIENVRGIRRLPVCGE